MNVSRWQRRRWSGCIKSSAARFGGPTTLGWHGGNTRLPDTHRRRCPPIFLCKFILAKIGFRHWFFNISFFLPVAEDVLEALSDFWQLVRTQRRDIPGGDEGDNTGHRDARGLVVGEREEYERSGKLKDLLWLKFVKGFSGVIQLLSTAFKFAWNVSYTAWLY